MPFTALDVQARMQELSAAGAPFALRDFDIDGIALKGYANAPADLVQLLQTGRAHGDKPFIVYEDQRLSFEDFFARADILASRLQSDFGIAKGERVAIAMRNCPHWAIAFVAAVLAGAVVVPLNSWGKAGELLFGVEDSGARVLVCDAQRLALIATELPPRGVRAIVADPAGDLPATNVYSFEAVLERGGARGFTAAAVQPGDPALILYTSGSTGTPKGVLHRHIGVSQALMNMYFLGLLNVSLEGPWELPPGTEGETPLLSVPLFHATGLVAGLLLPLQLGQKVVLMYKWDARAALRLIQEEKITGMTSVPAVLQDLFTHPDYDDYDTRSLFRVGVAGAATPEGLPELIEARVGRVSRSAGWGMTETMAVGTAMSGQIYDLNPAAAGVKPPIVDLRCVGPEGDPLPPGEIGELQIKGITVCAGYWGRPDATAEIIDGPWLRTGDLGRLDADGFLHITGRIKEIVIRGGENIYPGEIENVAYSMNPVQEVVVFGVPDAKMGEELAMVAYARPASALTAEALRAHVAERLAAYKVPKYVEISPRPLPQNASGKLFKRQIQENFVARLRG